MKKISLLIMMLVVLLSVFAIEASAEYYVNEEFTSDFGTATTTGNGTIEWVNGAMHVNASGENISVTVPASESVLPKNVTVMFDYKLDATAADNRRPIWNLYTGFGRASLSTTLAWMKVNGTNYATLAAEADTWYTVMVKFKQSGDALVFDLYRRETESEDAFVKYVSDCPIQTIDPSAKLEVYGTSWDAHFDNIKYYAGIFAEGTSIEFNGTPIDSASAIGNGTLKAKTMMVSDQVASTRVTPVLVVYNKNGRMISCTYVEADLAMGENDVEVTVDTSSFYNKINGGYAALYFIDDFDNLQIMADMIKI